MKHKLNAFTLVELIVVITILAILATIGFVSFSGYLAGTRDTNRIAQLKSMSDALELYRTKKDLPIPDNKVDVQANGSTIAYQGYIGANVLETIEYTEKGLDPKDKVYFSYYLTKDKKFFQLLSFLEEPSTDVLANTLLRTTQAVDYSERVPHVKGKKLGILTDENNTPIQEVATIQTAGSIDLQDVGATVYKSIISDEEITSGSGTTLSSSNPNGSCKRVKQIKGGSADGTYTIDPAGDGVGFEVYCDMTTDGGGWTSLVRINPSIDNSYYWETNIGTTKNGFYNYMNKSALFDVKEVYANKVVGWDGGEYVFEKVGEDLYSRRGALKDVVISADWGGLKNTVFYDWIGFQGTVNYNSVDYLYVGHMSTTVLYQDFPFYTTNKTSLSDNGWGGRQYTDNVVANIFVR